MKSSKEVDPSVIRIVALCDDLPVHQPHNKFFRGLIAKGDGTGLGSWWVWPNYIEKPRAGSRDAMGNGCFYTSRLDGNGHGNGQHGGYGDYSHMDGDGTHGWMVVCQ